MTKKKFKLKLASPRKGVPYEGLSFRHYIAADKAFWECPVISQVCGTEMDYGKLFAYCFRRFGYPNQGWDDYKELTRYLLTTPHPDLFLNIVPYVGNTTTLHFSFYVAKEAKQAIEAYANRSRTEWKARAMDWLEQTGLPDWIPDWVELCTALARAVNPEHPGYQSWRETVYGLHVWRIGWEGSPEYELSGKLEEFLDSKRAEYEAMDPYPAYYERPRDIESWDEADPLRPFVEAALVALQDLHRPVGVRDQAITAFGPAELTRSCAERAPVAGYPAGALGNAAPKEFSQLQGLVLKLGKGNVKRGIAKVLALAPEAS